MSKAANLDLLRASLGFDEIVLVGQPIISLIGSDGPSEYEVLAQPHAASGRVIPADTLFKQAERNGDILALDMLILHEIFVKHGEYLRNSDVHLSINLSATSICSDGTFSAIEGYIRGAAISPDRIQFEVTETSTFDDPVRARAQAEGLRAMGCRIALDDFGSGRSNFWRVRNLPVDCIKIDGCFVRGLVDPEGTDRQIVSHMVDFARKTGLSVVAEFVESQQILEAARELGIDKVQGFAVGRREALNQVLLRHRLP